jgi:PBP superfamily domain
MKKTLLAFSAAAVLTTAANAQVQLTITGSTAFRSVVLDRIPTLFDTNSMSANTSDPNKNQYFFSGTMSNLVPTFGNQPITIRTSFSGSGSGMLAVKNGTLQPCINLSGALTNLAADVALSDVYPASASPSIPASAFAQRVEVGVVPFVFAKNDSLIGVTNITREQAVLLMTASGDGGMPASYLGGVGAGAANPVYLIGRDSGSGTRISVEKDINFIGSPNLWSTNGDGSYSLIAGLSSGGTVAKNIAGGVGAIGYVGLADFITVTGISSLSYNGIPFSHNAVASGMYPIWGYEHLVSKIGMSANQQTLRDKLVGSITNALYQSSPIYSNSFVRLSDMQVKRGSDGGTITSLNF